MSTRTSRVGAAPSWATRALAALTGVVGAVAGIAPHVLHHVGPILGAAILTGTAGSVLFGVIGFALTIPMLLRLKRRFRSWLAPGVAFALFAAMFTISTLWIGPAIRSDSGPVKPEPSDPHHPSGAVYGRAYVLLFASGSRSQRVKRAGSETWRRASGVVATLWRSQQFALALGAGTGTVIDEVTMWHSHNCS